MWYFSNLQLALLYGVAVTLGGSLMMIVWNASQGRSVLGSLLSAGGDALYLAQCFTYGEETAPRGISLLRSNAPTPETERRQARKRFNQYLTAPVLLAALTHTPPPLRGPTAPHSATTPRRLRLVAPMPPAAATRRICHARAPHLSLTSSAGIPFL